MRLDVEEGLTASAADVASATKASAATKPSAAAESAAECGGRWSGGTKRRGRSSATICRDAYSAARADDAAWANVPTTITADPGTIGVPVNRRVES